MLQTSFKCADFVVALDTLIKTVKKTKQYVAIFIVF